VLDLLFHGRLDRLDDADGAALGGDSGRGVLETLPFEHLPVLEGVDASVDVRSVLSSEVELGRRVVVYAGDNYMQGLTAADTLLDRGHRVDLVVPAASPGAKAEAQTVQTVVSRLGGRHPIRACCR